MRTDHTALAGDFKFTTGNQQLSFMQHIMTVMGRRGHAAVVLPDKVLFEASSAGEAVRRSVQLVSPLRLAFTRIAVQREPRPKPDRRLDWPTPA